MTIYLITMGLIFLLYHFFNKKQKKIYLLVVIIVLFFMMGLRSFSVGTDIKNYMLMYNANLYGSYKDLITNIFALKSLTAEPLYFVYCSFLNEIGIDERGFLLITNFLLLCSLYYFYNKYSSNFLISLFSFFTIGLFPMYMSAIRQSLAISIIIFSYKCIMEKKPIKFYVLIILASLFHISALVMIPAYPLVHLLKKYSPYTILVIGVSVGVLGAVVLQPFLELVNISDRYDGYLKGEVIRTNQIVILMYLMIVVVCIYLYIVSKKSGNNKLQSSFKLFLIMYCIGLAILIVSYKVTIISRFSNYYFISLPIILSNSIASVKVKDNRILCVLICCIFETVFFIYTTPNSVYNLCPYKFLWEKY